MTTSCAWSLPGCLCPKKPDVPGEPLQSHGVCSSCSTAALAMARSDMARMRAKEAR